MGIIGGGAGQITPPTTVPKKGMNVAGNKLPAAANDGSTILLPGATEVGQPISRIDSAGSVVWTKTATALVGSADAWSPICWYDTVDAALWLMLVDTGPTPDVNYLVSIDEMTGAIIHSFSFAGATGVFQGLCTSFHFEREAMGSGNFNLWCGVSKYVISSTDGSLVSGPTVETYGGVPLYAYATTCGYRSADGTIRICGNITNITSGAGMSITIARGGGYAAFYASVPWAFGSLGSSGYISAIPWAGNIALGSFSSALSTSGPRIFARIDFDRWLNDMADFLGLP